jgi:hypothetical protein
MKKIIELLIVWGGGCWLLHSGLMIIIDPKTTEGIQIGIGFISFCFTFILTMITIAILGLGDE